MQLQEMSGKSGESSSMTGIMPERKHPSSRYSQEQIQIVISVLITQHGHLWDLSKIEFKSWYNWHMLQHVVVVPGKYFVDHDVTIINCSSLSEITLYIWLDWVWDRGIWKFQQQESHGTESTTLKIARNMMDFLGQINTSAVYMKKKMCITHELLWYS